MKVSRILSFTLFTLNIAWGKPKGGGAPASWLIKPLVVDLTPTGCTIYNRASLAIWAPTCTLCVLHQSTWLSANLLPLLDGSNVCALSQEPFPAFPTTIKQSSLGTHGSLQIEAPFPTVVELEALLGVDFGITIFSWIQPNIFFPQQA